MKKKMMFCGIALMFAASLCTAADGRSLRTVLAPALFGQAATITLPAPLSSAAAVLQPTPDPAYSSPAVVYDPSQPIPSGTVIGQPVELYRNVRYRAERNIACDAVPTIIQVADPCNKTNCCKNCVFIQVCMPPCEPKCVKCSRDGDAVRYDFGKYAVVARSVGDHVVVRYHD